SAGVAFARHDCLLTFASAGELEAAAVLLRGLLPAERREIRVGAASLTGIVNAPALDRFLAMRETSWFDRALRTDAFTSWFQPIVDLSTGLVFAHECLIRLAAGGEVHNGRDI